MKAGRSVFTGGGFGTSMEALIFYVLAAITVASALFVVFLRRPIHNVLFMIITMIGLAGLFILLQAEFVAMVQLIVYAGAVMVLFLFVIMLLNLDQVRLPIDPRAVRSWVGVALAVAVAVVLVPILKAFVPPSGTARRGKSRSKCPTRRSSPRNSSPRTCFRLR